MSIPTPPQSNYGTISGTNSGTIIATGTAGVGVAFAAGGTLIDSGTISGAQAAVYFGAGANLLGLEPGYRLAGGVQAVGSNNTLELLGSAGAPVTVNYTGLGLTNFQDLLFGPGALDTVLIASTAGTLGATISQFGSNTDKIDLTAIGTDGSYSLAANLVTVTGSLGNVTLRLDGSDASRFTTASDGMTGPCCALSLSQRRATSTATAIPTSWGRTSTARSTSGR